MKSLVLYHAHCTDGFGAAFAAWLVYKDNAEYIPLNYGQIKTISDIANLPERPIDSYQEIYVMDFSLPKDVMEWLFKVGKRVIWLDHHKTAFEMWCPDAFKDGLYVCSEPMLGYDNHFVVLDNDKSGAMLAWEYFHNGNYIAPPRMIQHIDDRDRWQFKLAGTKEFHAYMASRKPWSFMMWDYILSDMNKFDEQIYKEGAAILRAHEQNVKTVVEAGIRDCQIIDEFDGTILRGKAANCPPQFASDVGHELANRSETYGLCWYMGRDGKIKCSLRSNGEYDVSAIAKSFGGGGHQNASGMEVSMETLLSWLP